MNNADKLFDKLHKMPIGDLLILCGEAVNMKMDKKKLDAILLLLETRLQKKRMCDQLGIKDLP